jgi:DNA-binding response OmpR family regulator
MEPVMKPTLLVAEGDAELCYFYQRFLTERGYEVETAADGLDCVRKMRRLTPAVLVLDRDLRWGGGDGVLAWLREENSISGVPVVLMASASHAPGGSDDVKPPVVQVLPKPFALTALLESVRAALAHKERKEPFDLHGAPPCSEIYFG